MTPEIQYFHDRIEASAYEISSFGGRTYCVKVPSTKELLDILNSYLASKSKAIVLDVGMCTCHPKDRYIKKEGRRIAREKMSSLELSLETVVIKESIALFIFSGDTITIHLKAFFPDVNSRARLIGVFNADKY